VNGGHVVVTLIRDPLERPTLTFTADLLRPAQERLHEQVIELFLPLLERGELEADIAAQPPAQGGHQEPQT